MSIGDTSAEPRKSLILGLTGSVGSGKSFVTSLLADAQCRVICADTLAREAVQPGSEVLTRISQEFGDSVLRPDGSLDRPQLAAIVFADPAKRQTLEGLIHPYVRERERQLIREYSGHPLIVVDIPLLFESGFDRECDKVVVVVIDEETRIKRLSQDRGWTPAEVASRLAAQMSQTEKAARADFTIDNSGKRSDTARQIEQMLHLLFPNGLPHPIDATPLARV